MTDLRMVGAAVAVLYEMLARERWRREDGRRPGDPKVIGPLMGGLMVFYDDASKLTAEAWAAYEEKHAEALATIPEGEVRAGFEAMKTLANGG